MGNSTQFSRAESDRIVRRVVPQAHMYAGYNAQVCEYWKQRISKEENCVMGMLEQSRTTPRNPIVATKAKASRGRSRPSTAVSQGSRPTTAYTARTSSTMNTEEEALLRSTI